MDARLDGLDRIGLIVERRGRAGEIVDLIHFYVEREANIMAEHLELRMSGEMGDIFAGAGVEIVYAKNFVAIRKEPIAKVRSQKTGAASY